MAKIVDWERHIGRRLRLRDLHVFFTVVDLGSMAKAARHLRVTQPAVSQVIADLEHTLGVNLLDRGPRGVEPTIYGRALLKGGSPVDDEAVFGSDVADGVADQAACPGMADRDGDAQEFGRSVRWPGCSSNTCERASRR